MDLVFFLFFKQKTADERRISDWSSDVCTSDLVTNPAGRVRLRAGACRRSQTRGQAGAEAEASHAIACEAGRARRAVSGAGESARGRAGANAGGRRLRTDPRGRHAVRSEEHTSELQSLMRISYAVFCLKKKTKQDNTL